MKKDRRSFDGSLASRIAGVTTLAQAFSRVAMLRAGGRPVGLLLLLPVAIVIDLFDVLDEFAAGPVGMALSFFLEAAFLLGLTGRTSYAVGVAAFDIIPGIDVIPFATITLVREISAAWATPVSVPVRPTGPIIDV